MGGDHDERHRPVPQTGAEDKSVPATHEERVLVVGKGVVLTADVTSCEDVIVEGCFHGNIKAKTFVLAEGAQMEGEVRCAEARVGGRMKGRIITSKNLMIGSRAVVTGELAYDSLQIADGGRLQGKMMHISSAPDEKRDATSNSCHPEEEHNEGDVKMELEDQEQEQSS